MYKAYDFQCLDCGFTEDLLLDKEEIETKTSAECPQCGGEMYRMFGAPIVLKASYLDGCNRFAAHKADRKVIKEWKDAKRKKKLGDQIEIAKEAVKRKIPLKGKFEA